MRLRDAREQRLEIGVRARDRLFIRHRAAESLPDGKGSQRPAHVNRSRIHAIQPAKQMQERALADA